MADALTAERIEAALASLPGWTWSDDKLSKKYVFKHFREAMSFMVRISFEAEMLNHHPELFNVYNRVTIHLTTHDAGNKVTDLDVELASKIESLVWV